MLLLQFFLLLPDTLSPEIQLFRRLSHLRQQQQQQLTVSMIPIPVPIGLLRFQANCSKLTDGDFRISA
jgi:hypothetical protein